jgi:hypothetical protein
MSTTTISFVARINGALVDVDAITFDDQNEDFGVRRLDNLDVVVAAETAIPRLSLGTYEYEFTDPEPGLTYEYTVKVVYNSTTYYFNRRTTSPDVSNVIAIPSTDHYTSQAEVYRMMGEYAVELAMDDYAGEDKGYIWNDLLSWVDETIDQYIMQHYDINAAGIKSNPWLRRKAVVIAVHLLSQRRGNNPFPIALTDRVYEDLDNIRNNRFRIPGLTVSHWQGPMFRTYTMQNRFWNHPVRVDQTKSNKQRYSGQDDMLYPYMFAIGYD